MDITRNVCVREVFSEAAATTILPPETNFNTGLFNNSTHNQNAESEVLAAGDDANATNNHDLTNLAISKHRNSLPNVALPNLLNVESRNNGGDCESCVTQKDKIHLNIEKDTQKCITTNTILPSASIQYAANLSNDVHTLNSNNNSLVGDKGTAQQDVGCISGRLEIRVIPNGKVIIILFILENIYTLHHTVG